MCQIMLHLFSQLYRFLFNASSSKQTEKRGALEMSNKITVMENKIQKLEEKNRELQKQLDYNRNKEAALQKVLCNYDNLLKKVVMERNATTQDETAVHLANLEVAFCDLLQKYEKAKVVVQGFQQNENVLKKQVDEYETILESLKAKYKMYKSKSSSDKVCITPKTSSDPKTKKRRLVTTL